MKSDNIQTRITANPELDSTRLIGRPEDGVVHAEEGANVALIPELPPNDLTRGRSDPPPNAVTAEVAVRQHAAANCDRKLAEAAQHAEAGRNQDALDAGTKALEAARIANDPVRTARALAMIGHAQYWLRSMGEAKETLLSALDLAKGSDDHVLTFSIYRDLAVASMDLGDLASFKAFAAEANRQAEISGDPTLMMKALGNQGYEARESGRAREAAELFAEAQKGAGDDTGWASWWASQLGIALEDLRDHAGATKAYKQALDIAATGGWADTRAVALIGLGRLQLKSGEVDGARAILKKADKAAEGIGQFDFMPPLFLAICDLADHKPATNPLARALKNADAMLKDPNAPYPRFYHAIARLAGGDTEAINALRTAADDNAASKGLLLEMARLVELLPKATPGRSEAISILSQKR
jgi:tetratricopeptide (TPR) repeat protein